MTKMVLRKIKNLFVAHLFGLFIFVTLNSFCRGAFENQNVDPDIYSGITLFLGLLTIFCFITLIRLKDESRFKQYFVLLDGGRFYIKREVKQIINGKDFKTESVILGIYGCIISFCASQSILSWILIVVTLCLIMIAANLVNWLMVRRDWHKADAALREQIRIEKERNK